jgi:hypothetical protein
MSVVIQTILNYALFPQIAPLNKTDLRSLFQSIETSVPVTSRQAKAAQKWAKAIRWLDEESVTPEGRLVLEKDPYLEATVTDWLIHFYLSSGNWKLGHPLYMSSYLPVQLLHQLS